MSKVDWSLAPNGATHWVGGMHPWHQNIGTTVFYWSTCGGCWKKLTGFDVDQVNSQYLGVIQERPKQPQAWSGPEDGLPPVNTEVEVVEGPAHWDNLVSEWLGANVKVRATFVNDLGQSLAAVERFDGQCSCFIVECLAKVKTPEQLAAEKRETAIREFMDVVGIDCRVTASKAVDAGFKREVV